MLILSRKTNECVVIDGRVIVKVVRVEGDVVKIGIEAPIEIPIFRQEVYEEIQRNNREALMQVKTKVPKLRPPKSSQRVPEGPANESSPARINTH